ncbi:MAG: sulfatase [Ferruginibacter sp.]|uniref:LTA synthase family protein n=1 Tax=Ferruginibacter sp. TaxID=1940288 RepID=UPI00265841EC|nr:alkaline phosphatase family protein [Ferruginibacter sp.]MDB5277853.1 sulfatase [Ferruginibacter sp.]
MSFYKKLPGLVRWIIAVLLVFLFVMTAYRFFFFFKYNPPGKPFSGSAFLMGLRFDIKFVSILGVVMLVLCGLPFVNPLRNKIAKKIWMVLLSVILIVVLLFYVVDYFYYDYLQQRLNASILNYSSDASISTHMVMESYPVFKTLFVVLLIALYAFYIFNRMLKNHPATELPKRKFSIFYILFFLLLALGVFGKLGQFNLRWSDAFSLSDNFKANLSLNPFQSFFSTLNFKDTRPDIKKVRAAYPEIARYLNVQQPDSVHLNYERNIVSNNLTGTHPNVVIVICESFSMYRSSMSGNPLNTTPYFNSLCKNGVFFDRCFTPSYPTARGVWATVTSLPDVLGDNNRSASRNPEVVNQQLIINDFKGYDKFYFLGGDPSWANIKGVLLNNIDSLHLYSQENFKAKKLNVWGIDDKNLFLEANNTLAKQQRPFFAIIQTADNHRPYSIPAGDLGEFKKVNYPDDSIHKYGFENIDQLNAFRYTDFCYQQFFEAAKREKYFDNTIFVFVGDHGIAGNASALYPSSWTEQRLTQEHVPLLFYAPKLLQPKLVHTVCSQVDIVPSVASLSNLSYHNNSMGKNLFDTIDNAAKYAFIIDHDTKNIGVVNDRYFYSKNLSTKKETIVSVTDNNPVPVTATTDSIKNNMAKLTTAYYETARYLLFNNKRKY